MHSDSSCHSNIDCHISTHPVVVTEWMGTNRLALQQNCDHKLGMKHAPLQLNCDHSCKSRPPQPQFEYRSTRGGLPLQ